MLLAGCWLVFTGPGGEQVGGAEAADGDLIVCCSGPSDGQQCRLVVHTGHVVHVPHEVLVLPEAEAAGLVPLDAAGEGDAGAAVVVLRHDVALRGIAPVPPATDCRSSNGAAAQEGEVAV